MSFQRISADSTQVNYLKNLDDIDDIFNGLVQDDAVDMDQDFEDFLECFSDDEDESQNDSNYHPFPSFRNVSPSFQFSTFADSENPKRHQINRSTPNQGDHQFPHYDENQLDEDSVDEDDDLSDFFESSGFFFIQIQDHDEQKNDNDVEYIEIKYFEENYKIPIFTAKLFEPEQNADDKLLFQNSDLVNQKIDKIYEFYDHLKKLRLQKFQGDYSFSVYVLQCQQILFDEICKHFNKMLDIQQRWKKLSPSLIFNQRVEQFNLQLNQYKELVKYVFDTSATSLTGRRYFDQQKPAYFQDKKKEPSKKDLTEEEKILQLQQIPYNQNQKYQSNLLSILVFKAQHLQTQFAHFLHHKQQSEKNKFLEQKKQKMKQVLDFIWATRKDGVEIKNSRGKQIDEKDPLILINCLRKHKYKICGLGTSLTKNMSPNYCIANKLKQFEENLKQYLPKTYKRRAYYTPADVSIHNIANDSWVSFFGKVWDITQLVQENIHSKLCEPLIKNAGKDISYWFNQKTQEPRKYVDLNTGLESYYCPEGPYLHIPPTDPSSQYEYIDLPWWKNQEQYCIGQLSAKTRKIKIINMLTDHSNIIEVPSEETINEILDRYKEINAHAASYTWKRLGKPLDMEMTLSANGIQDETDEFEQLGIPESSWYIPAIHLYFNDDLTVA